MSEKTDDAEKLRSVATIDAEKIHRFAQAELDRQASAIVRDTIQAYMSKELVETIKTITRGVISSKAVSIRTKVEEYLTGNLDRLCESAARQMLEEALGEIKRRVIGRGVTRS